MTDGWTNGPTPTEWLIESRRQLNLAAIIAVIKYLLLADIGRKLGGRGVVILVIVSTLGSVVLHLVKTHIDNRNLRQKGWQSLFHKLCLVFIDWMKCNVKAYYPSIWFSYHAKRNMHNCALFCTWTTSMLMIILSLCIKGHSFLIPRVMFWSPNNSTRVGVVCLCASPLFSCFTIR